MIRSTGFSCSLIGQGTLMIQCGEILHRYGREIRLVCSPDPAVLNWATKHDIPNTSSIEEFPSLAENVSFDYLFSIVNGFRLDNAMIHLARKAAINFHDSPLPFYAGVNATSWAIMNGERTHAVTWHLMAESFDAGDILLQFPVPIEDNETAFTLNGKCYEAAISSFEVLIEQLENDTFSQVPQRLGERTYYSRSQPPADWKQGLISWSVPAYQLEALVRGLSFGPYPNPLALPKVLIEDCYYLVLGLSVLQGLPAELPGTITEVSAQRIVVVTGAGQVELNRLCEISGREVSIETIINRHQLRTGWVLTEPDSVSIQAVRAFDQQLHKHEPFWVDRLSGSEIITVPFYQSKYEKINQTDINTVEIVFPKSAAARFRILSAERSALHVFSAFTAYLARICRTNTLDIGYWVPDISEANLMLSRLFADYVPCRITIEPEMCFDEWLTIYESSLSETREHRTYANDLLARYPELKGLIGQPLFPVAYLFGPWNGQMITSLPCPLLLQIDPRLLPDRCVVFYDRTIIDDAHLARLLNHFLTFLDDAMHDLRQPIYHYQLLQEEERHAIINTWNNTDAVYSPHCFHQIVEDWAQRQPEAIALTFENQILTYSDLNRRANSLAWRLIDMGVTHGIPVGICLDRSPEMIISLLAVMKAGGAYVPLDPAYPMERLEYMLIDASVKTLITKPHLARVIPNYHDSIIYLTDNQPELSDTNPDLEIQLDQAAYIIYTSGTTGKPKGILINHRGLSNLKRAQDDLFGLGPQDCVLQFSSFSFDAAIWEISLAFHAGARLCMGTAESLLPGENLIELIQHAGVTVLSMPPSALAVLPDHELPNVGTIISGSEACWMELVERWAPGRRFFNGYGPTEITVCATFSEYSGRDWHLNIGRPIANTRVYILDPWLQPVPPGVPGEIHITSVGVAHEYLNLPDLTAAKFINDPFLAGGKMYRTGDLARYLADGNIEFLGRIDHQVKVRGFRIELEEIERVLLDNPAVKKCVVLAWGEKQDKRLAAYLMLHEGVEAAITDLREYLKNLLPAFMIPSSFIVLDSLPSLPNGKVDRGRLPRPTAFDSEREYVAPRTNTEQVLAVLWESVINIERIGIHDNFFDLGHSLMAIQMINRLNREQGISLRVSTLFQAPTIAELARFIDQGKAEGGFDPLICIQPRGTEPALFAVHPGDGNVFCFTDLVRRLGTSRPFYGFQAFGVEAGTTPLTSISEMARQYISGMKKVQPVGPYYLIGYCAGGTIAFEMAQQLAQAGDDIAILVLLDALAPYLYGPSDEIQNFMAFMRNFQGLANSDLFAQYCELRKIDQNNEEIYQDLQLLPHQTRLELFWEFAVRAGAIPAEVKVDYLDRLFQVWNGFSDLLGYQVNSYQGRLVLFRASDEPLNELIGDKTMGWRQASSTMESYDVPGNHYSMLREPHAAYMAKQLNDCLQQADQAGLLEVVSRL